VSNDFPIIDMNTSDLESPFGYPRQKWHRHSSRNMYTYHVISYTPYTHHSAYHYSNFNLRSLRNW
jgi:hypothetical protein